MAGVSRTVVSVNEKVSHLSGNCIVANLLKSSTTNQRKEQVGYNSVAIFIRLAVVASHICEIPRNSTKIRTYSNSWSSKVIDLGANRKRICNFLLVINSNYGSISYRFRDIGAFCTKIAVFPPHPCVMPPSGGTACNINVIYTPLKSTLIGLQFRRRHYRSIFIRLAPVGS